VDRGKLAPGLSGLAVFAVLPVAGVLPIRNGNSALTWADGFFNRLAKHSVNYLTELGDQVAGSGCRGDPAP
jgi:hypothetical protein